MAAKKTTTTTTTAKKKVSAKTSSAPTDELLRRICADPSNIEDRLVYADQLSDKGDPRGSFIADQLAIEKVDVLDERYAKMLAAIHRLEAKHAASEWLAEFLARVKISPTHFSKVELNRRLNAVFEGGFLQRIAMNPLDIPKHWDWLSEREPIVGVEVLVGEGLIDKEEAIKAPAKLRSLKVSPDSWFTSNSVGRIFGWGIPNVRELDLSGCDLGASGCGFIANLDVDMGVFDGWVPPPKFAKSQIERLILRTCQIGDEGAVVLFDAEPLDGLVELDISQCRLREKSTLEKLRDATRMKKITSFSIAGNNDLKGKIDGLAGWEALPRLKKIALPQAVSAKEVKALFPTRSKVLRELDVSSAKDLMKTDGVAAIQIAEALSHLDIGTTSLGDDGFAALLGSAMVENVISLQANGCSLSDESIDALCNSKLRRLVHLDLSSTKLTDAALAQLAKWPGIEHVTHLRTGNNRKLTSKGYDALIKSTLFQPASFGIGKQSDTKLVSNLRKRFGEDVVVAS